MKHFKNRMMNTQPLDLPVTREEKVKVVQKVYQTCPYCGGFRSRFVFSKLALGGQDGRHERRRCKTCLKDFDVYDPTYTRLETKPKVDGQA